MQISEQSKQGFEAAAEKLGLSKQLPDNSFMRPDLALYNTANYMLTVIVEDMNNGVINDITNHKVRKYEVWCEADHGYVPGSGTSGFRLGGAHYVYSSSFVGARLSFVSEEVAEDCFEKYPDLFEIIMLNVKEVN